MNPNSIGIEMLNLGKSDSIFVTLKDVLGTPLSILIDGGLSSEAEDVLDIYRRHHTTSPTLLVISTHSDSDHINGLPTILKSATNRNKVLFQNCPHDFVDVIQLRNKSRRLHSEQDRDSFSGLLERTTDLAGQAYRSGFTRYMASASSQPVFNWGNWNIYIAGPGPTFLRNMYTSDTEFSSMFSKRDGDPNVYEGSIDDGSDTSHINNSSIMILIAGPGGKFLFTGDAGVYSLNYARQILNLSNLTFLDVPHHGSRRNLDSAIIQALRPQMAYISCDGSDKHPGSDVINKLKLAGSQVSSTCLNNSHIYYNVGLPMSHYSGQLRVW